MPISTVTGTNMHLPARAAALANGTISHALDYDDTHFGYLGHPSVAIMPAALAVAEEVNATANEMLDAFLYGAECAGVGMVLGRDHYDAGFHQTATSGAFGATIAASKLRNLDLEVISTAIGLVSSRASGLKSQFGTMGKPFNAGTAAANGVEAATLAGLGFTASGDAFAGPQSFLVTHNSSEDRQKKLLNWPLDEFFFSSVSHKLYACCHGTHAMIEALLEFVEGGSLTEDNFEMIEVYVGSRWLNVCDIKPRTGLQIKFSYVFLAAMVLKQGKSISL